MFDVGPHKGISTKHWDKLQWSQTMAWLLVASKYLRDKGCLVLLIEEDEYAECEYIIG